MANPERMLVQSFQNLEIPPALAVMAGDVPETDTPNHLAVVEEFPVRVEVLSTDDTQDDSLLDPTYDGYDQLVVIERPEQGLVQENVLRQYLDKINQIPLIDADKEVELGRLIQTGLRAVEMIEECELRASVLEPVDLRKLEMEIQKGKIAERELGEANLRWVAKLAGRKAHQIKHMKLIDLIQEGNAGLTKAVRKFDPEKGFRFTTYATWWIKQAMDAGIANTEREIRIPRKQFLVIKKVRDALTELRISLEREPTVQEIADRACLDEVEVIHALEDDSYESERSLDEKVGEEGNTTLGEMVIDQREQSPSDSERGAKIINALVAALDNLPNLNPRNRDIFLAHYGITGSAESAEELADRYNITPATINGILRATRKQLLTKRDEIFATIGGDDHD